MGPPSRLRGRIALLSFSSLLFLGGCATLPDPPVMPPVSFLPAPASGLPAEVSAGFAEKHGPEKSGFSLLERSDEALRWRLALADEATQSIDIQYFIWQGDEAGLLLFDRLLEAADRGVRVRLLVDDLGIAARDRNLAAITTHPNFDLKIFNPGRVRGSTLGGGLEFLLRFRELNRRMHNKLFVVDSRMAVVGGRNIGNEYFGLGEKYNFRDLDVLVTGAVVGELSRAYDKYWNAELAYPGSAMSDKETPADLAALREDLKKELAGKEEMLASYPVRPKEWREEFQALVGDLLPGEAHFIQDEPVLLGEEEYRLTDMLRYVAGPSREELTAVSPYLIPVGDMLENLQESSARGVKVSILTASMASNNHTAAHSHYKKYRRRIIGTGADLYEFKDQPAAEIRALTDVPPVKAKFISLHVKAVVADRARCFIGSLNLDPRAIDLNTENGLYIESPALCGELDEMFDTFKSPENAWHVTMKEDYTLWWESDSGITGFQPARGFGQRIADFIFRLIPIENQL